MPWAMAAGPVKRTAYLHPSGVRYGTRLLGVPRARRYGRRLLAVPARNCGLTAQAARAVSPAMYAAPGRPDKRVVGGGREGAGCSA